jgi:hypothetical protein
MRRLPGLAGAQALRLRTAVLFDPAMAVSRDEQGVG